MGTAELALKEQLSCNKKPILVESVEAHQKHDRVVLAGDLARTKEVQGAGFDAWSIPGNDPWAKHVGGKGFSAGGGSWVASAGKGGCSSGSLGVSAPIQNAQPSLHETVLKQQDKKIEDLQEQIEKIKECTVVSAKENHEAVCRLREDTNNQFDQIAEQVETRKSFESTLGNALQSQESSLLVQIQAMLQANQGKKVEKIDSDEDMYEDTKRAKKAKS